MINGKIDEAALCDMVNERCQQITIGAMILESLRTPEIIIDFPSEPVPVKQGKGLLVMRGHMEGGKDDETD
jgi:hypothetical protein